MAKFELIMPKMGESIVEATILNWMKKEGETVEEDETVLEIATDKVDSEVPSPVTGVIQEIKFQENDTVAVGEVIAIIATEAEVAMPEDLPTDPNGEKVSQKENNGQPITASKAIPAVAASTTEVISTDYSGSSRFYSPLVKNIAKQENISLQELEQISGTGKQGRVTKKDILAYLKTRHLTPKKSTASKSKPQSPKSTLKVLEANENVEIIEMDRMRKLIADHMVMSKQTSPHVTSFVEVDVTDIVNWRNKIKASFQKEYGQKITYTPIFIDAVVKALRDYPMVNISVEGNKIIRKKQLNIGMAAALPSGNLIVPVIKNADHLSLVGLTKTVNDLASRARANQLKPEEIQDGTFTITNVGTFGNVMGTPIINQPQVAILAVGAIRKKPAVVETEYGDLIAVRHMMFLSLSYDHRVVDGFLGGSFLRRIADYLEQFDSELTL